MFNPDDILYEDNHLLIVNKRCAARPVGRKRALEDQIKAFIKRRDAKPGEVFLGVVHRIDRPVSGAVVFAKTSKALVRLNEMIREGRIHKVYWALTEATPDPESGELRHYILRDGRTNRSRACTGRSPAPGGAPALRNARGGDELHAGRGRTAHGASPPDPRPALEGRVPDPRRPEIRRPALPARGRHLAPLAPCRIRASGASRAALGHGSRACGRQPVDLFRKPLNIPAKCDCSFSV